MPEGNEDGSMKYFIFILKYPQSLKWNKTLEAIWAIHSLND